MIAAVIRWSARNLLLVGFAGVFLTLAGLYAVSRVPLDAIPDRVHGEFVNYAAIGIWNRPRQWCRQA